MKRIPMVVAMAAILALGGLLKAEDTVVLTDGTVIMGRVMEETTGHVVIMDQGVQRTLRRSLVSKVEFDTSPDPSVSNSADPSATDASQQSGDTVPSAPQAEDQEGSQGPSTDAQDEDAPPEDASQGGAGNVVPDQADQDQQQYAAGVSGYYSVPEDEVWGYELQGIGYEELPVVFYVARRAQCAPGLVVSLRLSGMSWQAICMHFGLDPGIFYWHSLFATDLGGPYGDIYMGFHRHPHRFWTWSELGLSDAQIVDCVNLRFQTAWWHCRPYDVVRWRRMGHPFFWAGYGGRGHFNGRAWAGNKGAWGAGRRGADGQRGDWNRGAWGAGQRGAVGQHGGWNRGAWGAGQRGAVGQRGGWNRGAEGAGQRGAVGQRGGWNRGAEGAGRRGAGGQRGGWNRVQRGRQSRPSVSQRGHEQRQHESHSQEGGGHGDQGGHGDHGDHN
ncbi:MAG: hypothetical protein ACREKE_06345 [bacterium]